MNTREHYELFRYLMEQVCLFPEDLIFVDNIAAWCREQGIPETDEERPMKLISREQSGCRMLIREILPARVLSERITALGIRSQLKSVAMDRGEALDSDRKKLAYLFLSEYAVSLPEVLDDFLADDWAFDEMKRLGFFKQ